MKKMILLTSALALLLAGCGSVTNTHEAPNIEPTIENSTKINASFSAELEAKMQAHNLKGFSMAVIEDYKVVYSNQWGIKAAGSDALLDQDTAFSTASTAKVITALICLMMEEKGLINLDDPISDYLTRWSLPESDYTKNIPVTWKHLLSHMAGTTQHGFADFYEGDAIPTLIDSVEGRLPRYSNEPISFEFEPGTDWKYSGGGYTIIQMALEDHFKKPLHILASENIFGPLGMDNTTMIQPNEAGFLTNVASVHDSDGNVIRSGLPITPQVSASGMWSTPQDLAKLAIAMQKTLRGDKNTVISRKVATAATDIISIKTSGGNSLGWMRAFGFGNTDWMRFSGSNTGVGSDLLASMEDGYGLIFFANGEKPNRFPVTGYVRGEVIEMMQWGSIKNKGKAAPKNLIDAVKGPYKDLLYGMSAEVMSLNDKVYLVSPVFQHFLGKDRSEMIYLGENTFKVLDYPNQIRFNLDDKNQVRSLTMLRNKDDNLSVNIELAR